MSAPFAFRHTRVLFVGFFFARRTNDDETKCDYSIVLDFLTRERKIFINHSRKPPHLYPFFEPEWRDSPPRFSSADLQHFKRHERTFDEKVHLLTLPHDETSYLPFQPKRALPVKFGEDRLGCTSGALAKNRIRLIMAARAELLLCDQANNRNRSADAHSPNIAIDTDMHRNRKLNHLIENMRRLLVDMLKFRFILPKTLSDGSA